MLTLLLGGARSGKSAYAEELARAAEASGSEIVYLATAEAKDAEMRSRIEAHRARRPRHWRTREVPIELARALAEEARPGRLIIVDCLTLWLTNVLLADPMREEQPVPGATATRELAGLRNALRDVPGEVILVSNEVGLSLVAPSPLGRLFTDEQGRLNQEMARAADTVWLLVAGCPLRIKPGSG